MYRVDESTSPPKINRYLKTIIEKQKEENYVLENKVVSSIMVIKNFLILTDK